MWVWDWVREINEWAVDGVIPDLVVVLDVDPEEGLRRQHREDRIGREGVDFQSRCGPPIWNWPRPSPTGCSS